MSGHKEFMLRTYYVTYILFSQDSVLELHRLSSSIQELLQNWQRNSTHVIQRLYD